MFDYLEAILLNVLFLVVFLLFIPHLVGTTLKFLTEKQKSFVELISILLAMICCMFFPFQIGEELLVDLRTVALIVGGLYLGRKASIILVTFVVIIRFYISGGFGDSFYAALTTSLILLGVLMLLAVPFKQETRKGRIVIACLTALIMSTLIIFIRFVIFGYLRESDYMVVLLFLIIHFLSTFFIVYFYELIKESDYINKQIIKAEKLELVSHLASSISHEVRNPLTVVKRVLQMLNQKDWDEEKRGKFIELALQEIDRANDIIRNYLTFAKQEEQEHQMLELKDQLLRAIDVITPMATMNNVDIQTNFASSCIIKGDPQLLQQCFLNITKNCIEAMPNGGILSICTELSKDHVVVEITDNGEGMTSEQLRRIGEPYFTTKGREGTGLGMMAVLKIIKLMNGRLEVSSHRNEGTQFRIYFPK